MFVVMKQPGAQRRRPALMPSSEPYTMKWPLSSKTTLGGGASSSASSSNSLDTRCPKSNGSSLKASLSPLWSALAAATDSSYDRRSRPPRNAKTRTRLEGRWGQRQMRRSQARAGKHCVFGNVADAAASDKDALKPCAKHRDSGVGGHSGESALPVVAEGSKVRAVGAHVQRPSKCFGL